MKFFTLFAIIRPPVIRHTSSSSSWIPYRAMQPEGERERGRGREGERERGREGGGGRGREGDRERGGEGEGEGDAKKNIEKRVRWLISLHVGVTLSINFENPNSYADLWWKVS